WRKAFKRERALPASVRGPVLFWAFSRFALSWESDSGIVLLSGVVVKKSKATQARTPTLLAQSSTRGWRFEGCGGGGKWGKWRVSKEIKILKIFVTRRMPANRQGLGLQLLMCSSS